MDLNKLLKTQWDRAGAIGLSVLGAVFLLVGWIGVSGTPLLAEQAPYILSGGVGGLFLLGLGATLWISADLRDEWRKLDRIEAAIGDGTLRWAEEAPPVVAEKPREVRVEAPRVPVLAQVEAPTAAVSSNGHSAVKSTVNGSAKAARTATAPRRPRAKAASNDA